MSGSPPEGIPTAVPDVSAGALASGQHPLQRPRPRRRRRTAGDLQALRRELWHGLQKVGDLLDDPNAEPAELCKAANALAALGNAYRGATEAADLLPRLEALEHAAAQGRP